ncbi:unnamed protein product [Vitrella brassicaformis CCMP3155]|uniref:Anaphase-promoting complex subunit 4 WD40 domain-containing protein n=1 Tax=Vitrella brassicaformis (strain CCMP3155) TaxID=1169540 RepID=A0A0G4F0S8_VITBC|nr:unnamed protein product [Vitrella brassicaformis CCMP3155]|eukprot:CEM05226.1 unnamed protein product [Vitrella brassicaformis CCMP3155]
MMSENAQVRMVRERTLGRCAPMRFWRGIYASKTTIGRMKRGPSLQSHHGCVNSINWNETGSMLVSGSDDTALCVWDYPSFKLRTRIETGHLANIFCGRFMPTDNETIISCSADSQVRVCNLSTGRLIRVYTDHTDRVKKLATETGNRNVFLSCAEDGTVRQFDLRVDDSRCARDEPEVRPRFGRLGRMARRAADRSPANVLAMLDGGGDEVGLSSISLAALRPEYFVIGGDKASIWLFDRRMLSPRPLESFTSTPSVPAAEYQPPERRVQRLTGVNISYDGKRVIGSWSEEHIYMFNVDKGVESYTRFLADKRASKRDRDMSAAAEPSRAAAAAAASSSADDGPKDTTNSSPDTTPSALPCPTGDAGPQPMDLDARGKRPRKDEDREDESKDSGESSPPLCVPSRRLNLPAPRFGDGELDDQDLKPAADVLDHRPLDKSPATADLPAPGSGQDRDKKEDRNKEDDKQQQGGGDELEVLAGVEVDMFGPPTPGEEQRQQQQQQDGEGEEHEKEDHDHDDDDDSESLEKAVSSSSSGGGGGGGSGSRAAAGGSGGSGSGGAAAPHAMDDDDDSDDEPPFIQLLRSIARNRQPRSPARPLPRQPWMIDQMQTYTGHCNVRTVKDVQFVGPYCEYAASGSDDGRIFIWDAFTGSLVWIGHDADCSVVNCIAGHPRDPVLTSSGIDNDVKVWYPTAPRSMDVTTPAVARILADNERNRTSLRTGAFLTRAEFQQLRQMIASGQRHTDDDGEDGEGEGESAQQQAAAAETQHEEESGSQGGGGGGQGGDQPTRRGRLFGRRGRGRGRVSYTVGCENQ